MPDYLDKRQHKRVIGVFEITLVPPSGEKIQLKAYNYDISEGGIRCIIPRDLVLGSCTHIKISFPRSAETLVILGEIVWTRPWKAKNNFYECGIKFFSLADSERGCIREFVRANEQQGG